MSEEGQRPQAAERMGDFSRIVFFLGGVRSGTTVFRRMLASHPQMRDRGEIFNSHNSMGFFETSVNALMNAKVHSGSGDPKSIDTSKAFQLKKKGMLFGTMVVTEASIQGATGVSASTATASAPLIPQSGATSSTGFAYALGTPSTSTMMAPAIVPSVTTTPVASESRGVYKPNFVDYVSGGLELQLSVAIDFTGSNGDPRKPGTLHYIDHTGSQLNDYEKALTAVGSIVAKYDSDQKFPMLGFGAKFRGVIDHSFQLGPTAEVSGIQGMIDAYRSTFKTGLTMSGPTVFSEVIQLAAAQAKSKQEASQRIGMQAYHILLILTDGAVSDINQTKQAIRAASDAPLSIVIVGIGNADFSAMQFLDDFISLEGIGGRDICQFVEFQRYQSNKIHLTQATLEEIPDQVVEYFHSRGIKPLPPIRGSRVNVVADECDDNEGMDLSLYFGEDGAIMVVSGGVMDDTGYGMEKTYFGVIPLPLPSTTSTPSSYAPQQPTYGAPYANAGTGYTKSYQPPQEVYGQPPVVTATVVAQPVFHVQVPPGANAGQQLQIMHPQTQLPMIVTIPQGVAPGGVFSVPY